MIPGSTVCRGLIPDVPEPFRIVDRTIETSDVVTLRVVPLRGTSRRFEPAQFAMIGIGALGDVPISMSSTPPDTDMADAVEPVHDVRGHRAAGAGAAAGAAAGDGAGADDGWAFTIRRAGAVTQALTEADVGDVVTVRGPFGVPWDLDRARGRHAVFVAGGLGLAPLRAAIAVAVARRTPDESVTVLVGAKNPDELLYRGWLNELSDAGANVAVTVDSLGLDGQEDQDGQEGQDGQDGGDGRDGRDGEHGLDDAAGTAGVNGADRDRDADVDWAGSVGFVTDLIADHVVDPERVEAYVCGPDPMMDVTIGTLRAVGVGADHIEVTLERNMQCGVGWCGHCQLGPLLVCCDGPVVRADRLADLLERSEL